MQDRPSVPTVKAIFKYWLAPFGSSESEQQIIKLARAMREEKFSYQRIADTLNATEFARRSGGEWKRRHVINILKTAQVTA